MPPPTQEIDPKIFVALIAGGFALFGATIGTILTFVNSTLERRQNRKEIARQKYEELTDMVGETVSWFPILDGCKSAQSVVDKHPPKSVRRLASLAMIYFPKLKDKAKAYSSGVVEYYEWAANCPRNEGESLGEAVTRQPDLDSRLNQLDNLRHDLEDLIEQHAKKHTNQ